MKFIAFFMVWKLVFSQTLFTEQESKMTELEFLVLFWANN